MQIKWSSLAYVRYVFFYIAGIITFQNTSNFEYLLPASILLAFLVASYIAALFFTPKAFKRKFTNLFSITGFLLVFVLALCNSAIQKEQHEKLFQQFKQKSFTAYTAKVVAPPQEKANGFQVELAVSRIKTSNAWLNSKGAISAYLPFKDSLPQLNDILLINGKPNPYPKPLNPAEFNYGEYMNRQGIFLQHYLPKNAIRKIGEAENNLLSLSYKLRAHFADFFTSYIPGKAEQGIALALVLGIKDNLDHEIRDAYSGAGAMHVLAVSGLHVGILSSLIGYIFLGFKNKRYIKWIYIIISVLILWMYAAVTGFSPSVVRACTMFTFVSFAQFLDRKSNIYNTLAASALCMLIYNPNLIFQVGFQLSYIAVLGIVFLYPKIYDLLKINNKVLDKLWAISVVSIAAQIATFPISLYYFNQFPVYFLLANPVVIMGATVVVLCGIIGPIILWPFPTILAVVWGMLMNSTIYLMNLAIFWVNQLPFSRTDPIHFLGIEVLLLYSLIISFILFLLSRKLQYFKVALSIVVLFSGFNLYQKTQNHYQESLTIYAIKKHTCIGIIHRQKAYLMVDRALANDTKKIAFHVENHLLSQGFSNYELISFDQDTFKLPFGFDKKSKNLLLAINGKSIAVLDKETNFNSLPQVDVCIIRNRNIYQNKDLADINVQLAIFDGSSRIYGHRNEQGQSRKTVYFASQEGAFEYPLN